MKGWLVACAIGATVAAMLCGGAGTASAVEQVVLSQGEAIDGESYLGARDVILINGSFAPRHYGTGSTLWVGTGPKEDAAIRRSLLAFDLASLPASVRTKSVRRAMIRLTCTQVSGEAFVWQMYAVAPENAVWLQEQSTGGRSEGKALPNVCSWNFRINFYQAWSGGEGLGEPGAGYGEVPLFEQSTGSETVRTGSVVEIEVPHEVVERWLSGVNGGVLLRMQEEAEEAGQYIRFGSSKHSKTGERPVLEIEFE